MNIYYVAIGFIIGVVVERATKLSFALQKSIKQYKQKRKDEAAAKQKLIDDARKQNPL
jgi:hypothetical protein